MRRRRGLGQGRLLVLVRRVRQLVVATLLRAVGLHDRRRAVPWWTVGAKPRRRRERDRGQTSHRSAHRVLSAVSVSMKLVASCSSRSLAARDGQRRIKFPRDGAGLRRNSSCESTGPCYKEKAL